MSIERGNLLFESGRFDAAEQEFRATLAQEPSNAMAHAMIGLCLLRKGSFADATVEARLAIELSPDSAFGYRVLAEVLGKREHLKEALEAIEQSIQVDPYVPASYAILASIRLKQSQWAKALEAADRGLEIDPTNAGCVNLRGMALVQLGRRDEAAITIEGALARDPENAMTHTNRGWALLHANDHLGAMTHFREALRLDPELQWAKQGMLEAMKARYIVYRVMLRFFLFMSRMTPQVRWGIVLGGYFGYQALREFQSTYPAIRPFAIPLMVAYLVFVVLTWLAAPAFNLMLRLNRFARYALTRDQTIASNWFGGCLVAAILAACAGFYWGNDWIIFLAVLTALMSIPITSVFNCPVVWPRRGMAAYCVGLGSLAVVICMDRFPQETQVKLIQAFFYAFLASSFLANMLVGMRVRK